MGLYAPWEAPQDETPRPPDVRTGSCELSVTHPRVGTSVTQSDMPHRLKLPVPPDVRTGSCELSITHPRVGTSVTQSDVPGLDAVCGHIAGSAVPSLVPSLYLCFILGQSKVGWKTPEVIISLGALGTQCPSCKWIL